MYNRTLIDVAQSSHRGIYAAGDDEKEKQLMATTGQLSFNRGLLISTIDVTLMCTLTHSICTHLRQERKGQGRSMVLRFYFPTISFNGCKYYATVIVKRTKNIKFIYSIYDEYCVHNAKKGKERNRE